MYVENVCGDQHLVSGTFLDQIALYFIQGGRVSQLNLQIWLVFGWLA